MQQICNINSNPPIPMVLRNNVSNKKQNPLQRMLLKYKVKDIYERALQELDNLSGKKEPNAKVLCDKTVKRFDCQKLLWQREKLRPVEVGPSLQCLETHRENYLIPLLRQFVWLSSAHFPMSASSCISAVVYPALDDILKTFACCTAPPPQVSMQYELLRFHTLRNFPKEDKPYIIRLAQAGFYYASDGDEVVCYVCGLSRKNWHESDIPIEVHRNCSPNCRFLTDNAEVNVPIPRQSNPEGHSTLNSGHPRFPQYSALSMRLSSFTRWPNDLQQQPKDLAEAGFYYAGIADMVQCYYCGIGLRQWISDDDVWIEHARWSRNCGYLQTVKGAEFIQSVHQAIECIQGVGPPGEMKESHVEVTPSNVVEVPSTAGLEENVYASVNDSNALGIPAGSSNASSASIMQQETEEILYHEMASNNPMSSSAGSGASCSNASDRPKYPKYDTRAARISSFNVDWPDSSYHTPEALANAGFYYGGIGDYVRCFSCGVGLRHWTEEDDRWVEHARWSRNCRYLQDIKGEEFIQLVHMAIAFCQEEEVPPGQDNESNGDIPASKVIDHILHSAAAQSVMEMGYSSRTVLKAIEKMLERGETTGITVEIILEHVLKLEEEDVSDLGAQGIDGSGNGDNGVSDQQSMATKSPTDLKKENESLIDQLLCRVCMVNMVNMVFLPCGHLVTCIGCAFRLQKCPVCRALVTGVVKRRL